VLGLDGFRSLLLYSVNAASLLVKLNESLAGGVFDLQGFRSLSDGYAVLLGEFDEHSTRLGRDRVVMVSLLGVTLLMLWNFGEHLQS